MIELLKRLEKKPQYKIVKLFWNGVQEAGVVLIDRKTDHDSYVTWAFNKEGMTFAGEYFNDQQHGILSYRQRAGRIQ